MRVIKSVFIGSGRDGDFEWMIGQPDHERTLFVFNDNEDEFYAHVRGGEHSCSVGGGNAVIRPYQCDPYRRAAGMPTGTYQPGRHFMGYSALDEHVRQVIADAIAQIDELLTSGRFEALAVSWDDETKLGGRIFDAAQDVRDHIVEQIFAVADRHAD